MLLQDEEARAAEAEVLGRAAGLAPAGALAADEQVTARARELKQAGLEGDMGQLRARAFLDLLLGADSRPGPDGADPAAEPAGGAVPGGFAGRVTLTVPLITPAGLADRPGELGGLGPVDPWLARDLARAAAASPASTWCLAVTDGQGHAVAHGCARPGPKKHGKRAGPGPPDGAGFRFVPAGRDGPPRQLPNLAADHPGRGPGPDHHHRPGHHRPACRARPGSPQSRAAGPLVRLNTGSPVTGYTGRSTSGNLLGVGAGMARPAMTVLRLVAYPAEGADCGDG